MDEITVRKMSYPVTVPLDEDGTPLWNGERMVEVGPDEWMTPEAAAFLKVAESAKAELDRWLADG